MDSRIMRCNIISSCQSAATSEIVKALLSMCSSWSSAISSTGPLPNQTHDDARVQLVLENVSAPTGGLLVYADKEGGYSSNSEVVFLLLVNETFGDQLLVMFGDGQRRLVDRSELTRISVLPDWTDPHLGKLFSYHTMVSKVYRQPGTYEVFLLTNDSSGNVVELSQTTIAIGYEEIELKHLELTTCVDDNGSGTILITSRRRLCDVVAEWSYDNQLFIDLVSFSDVQVPVWAAVDDDDKGTLFAATLSCRDAVTDGRKEFVVGLTGRVFNTTYKFAATRLVRMRPVDVELVVTARRVPAQRAAVLRIESIDNLESLHVTVPIANDVFSENVELNPSTINGSIVYATEMTIKIKLPVPELVTATLIGSKEGACFVISKTIDVVDRSGTGVIDFEVFSQVDDAGNAAVVLLAGTRVNDVRVSWGSDVKSFVRTVVDLVPDERPPLWLSTSVRGYYTATLTHRFVGSAPNTSMLTIVEHADDSFAQVKAVRLNRRQPSREASTDIESPSSSSSSSALPRAGTSVSDCDARPSGAASSSADTELATETRGPIDSNVYVTTRNDDDGIVTLEFFARHPVRNMIVDWDMPGTASRRMINVVQPAADVDGYFTATIRRSFDISVPNVTQVRMTGRIEGVTFNVSKGLDHSRQPHTAGIVAMLPVFPAPIGFAEEHRTAFRVKAHSHYVSRNNVTIPAVVMSHDEGLKEVLVIDVTCSVRQTDGGSTSLAADYDNNNCRVTLHRVNGSLTLFIPSSNLSPGRYKVQIQVFSSSLLSTITVVFLFFCLFCPSCSPCTI